MIPLLQLTKKAYQVSADLAAVAASVAALGVWEGGLGEGAKAAQGVDDEGVATQKPDSVGEEGLEGLATPVLPSNMP